MNRIKPYVELCWHAVTNSFPFLLDRLDEILQNQGKVAMEGNNQFSEIDIRVAQH